MDEDLTVKSSFATVISIEIKKLGGAGAPPAPPLDPPLVATVPLPAGPWLPVGRKALNSQETMATRAGSGTRRHRAREEAPDWRMRDRAGQRREWRRRGQTKRRILVRGAVAGRGVGGGWGGIRRGRVGRERTYGTEK